VRDLLAELSGLCTRFDPDTMYALLQRLVPEYRPERGAGDETPGQPERLH